MKQIFLIFALAAAFTSAMAQKLTMVTNPDEENPLMALCISDNGQYIGGSDAGYGYFVADWQKNNVMELPTKDDTAGSEIRAVSNDGTGVGFDLLPIKLDMFGTRTELADVNGIGEDITPDGKLIVGSIAPKGALQYPCIWKDGVKIDLPHPTTEELGFEYGGSTARLVSADGKTIVGYVVDSLATFPMIAWRLSEDGKTYNYDFIAKDFFAPNENSKNNFQKIHPVGLSGNGRYIALWVKTKDMEKDGAARYDLATGKLEVMDYDPNDAVITKETRVMPADIADDGTLVGYTYEESPKKALIWYPDSKYMALMADAFPEVSEFAQFDEYGLNGPARITPDGRYIVGLAYAMVAENMLNYASYVLDVKGTPSGITSVHTEAGKAKTQRFTIDGRQVSRPVKGLNILRTSDGKVVKVMVK